MVVPLTAGAALAKGHVKWCISNKTRWDAYFRAAANERARETAREDFKWRYYTDSGPFAFITWKAEQPSDSNLERLAAHVKFGENFLIEYWDLENRAPISQEMILRRLDPPLRLPFEAAVSEIQKWFTQFQREHLEQCPAMEHLAQILAAWLLEDIELPFSLCDRG